MMLKIAVILMIFFLIWLPLYRLLDWYAKKLVNELNSPEERAKMLEQSIEDLNIEIAVKKGEVERQLAELEQIRSKFTKKGE